MPAGIVITPIPIVNEICTRSTLPIAYEVPSRNDLLEALNVIIKFILAEKGRKNKRFKAKEMKEVVQKINTFLEKQTLVLVGIDGLGGAGKSAVANSVKENIPNVAIIEMDDFYVPEFTRADWDRVYEQVIEPLRKGSSASYQRFDWDTKKLAEWHEVKPKGVVIIEGVYALHEKLRDAYDYKIWVEAPYELRLQRGLERDGEEARSWWINEWMLKEEEYKESQKPHESADIIIDGSKG